MADHADHVLIIPAEGISNFRPMTVATSLAYGLAAALVGIEPQRSRSAIAHVDRLWQDMDFFVVD